MLAGTIDTTFGTNGKFATSVTESPFETISQPDGKTILLSIETAISIQRFNTNGTLDTTFGSNGRISETFEPGTVRNSRANIIRTNDGSILLIRETTPDNRGDIQIKVTKYNNNGGLDTNFGSNGTLISANRYISGTNTAVVIGDKIFISGSKRVFSSSESFIELYNRDSTRDTAFGNNGQVNITSITGIDGVGKALLQSDGKIVVAAAGGLVRLMPNGTIDSTFNNPGSVGGSSYFFQQSDGKIITGNTGQRVIRVNTDGTIDRTFGRTTAASAITLQSNDKIIIGASEQGDFKIRRYDANGVLDVAFGSSGVISVDFGAANDTIKRLDITADGRLFASGIIPSVGAYKVLNAAIITGEAVEVNLPPVVNTTIADQTATTGRAFNFTIPANSFSDPNIINTFNVLTYTATLADATNSSLPSWLTFNAATRTFSGTPPANAGNLNLRVRATDNGGLSVSDEFTLTNVAPNTSPGAIDLSFATDGKLEVVTNDPSTTLVQPDGKLLSLSPARRIDSVRQPVTDITIRRFMTDGNLDTTFGSGGTINTTFESGSTDAAIRRMNDGSILLIREASPVVTDGVKFSRIKVTKYDGSGVLDANFGTNGTLTSATNFSGLLDTPVSTFAPNGTSLKTSKTVIVSGDKIIIGGSEVDGGPITVELYNNNGTAVDGFGTNGVTRVAVPTPIGRSPAPTSGVLAGLLQSDGKILLAGPGGLLRLTTAGEIDTTFSNPGRVDIKQLLRQSDGKILVVDNENSIVRLNANGTVDGTFNYIKTNVVGDMSVLLQSDDKIIIGVNSNISNGDFLIARHNSNGVLDTTFGSDGLTLVNFVIGGGVKQLDIAPDGRLIASGVGSNRVISTAIFTGVNPANNLPVVANAIADQTATIGSAFNFVVPSNSFSDPNTSDTLTYSATLANGSALPAWLAFDAATKTFSGTPPTNTNDDLKLRVRATDNSGFSIVDDFNLAVLGRPSTVGSLDRAFGDAGKFSINADILGLTNAFNEKLGTNRPLGYFRDLKVAKAFVQPDGKTLAWTTSAFSGVGQLARFNVDGSPDLSFSKITSAARHVVQQSDGKFLVAEVDRSAISNTILKRYSADGVIDATFGSNGSITVLNNDASSFVKESNGKILIVGGSAPNTIVTRYNIDGTLDTTLGNNGDFRISGRTVFGGVQQQDGKFLLGWRSRDFSTNFITRYNVDGTVDSVFGTSGTITINDSLRSAEEDLILLRNGKILLAGGSTEANRIIRYNSDGSLDIALGSIVGVSSPLSLISSIKVTEAIDGKLIIAGGTVGNTSSTNDFRLTQYNADGSIDPAFVFDDSFVFSSVVVPRTKNWVGTDLDGRNDVALAVAQDSAGNIIIAGGSDTLRVVYRNNDVPSITGFGAARYINSAPSNQTNQAPVVANAIADTTATIGTAFSFTVPANSFSDPDTGNTLTYSGTQADGSALPTWLTFDANTRTFSGTPPTGTAAGALALRVTATDNGGLSVNDDFNVTLSNSAPVNQAPVVANAIADTTATVGNAFSFAVPANSFSDPDAGNTLTYSGTQADGSALPTWLTFDASTRTFSGTPPTGTNNLALRVTATDNSGMSVNDDFNIAVSSPPTVPPLTGTRRITLTPDKQQSNNDSTGIYITMSSDGRYVLYGSKASNLVAGDTNNQPDLFLYDRTTDTNIRIGNNVATDSSSGSTSGLPFTPPTVPGALTSGVSVNATISSNGQYVVYQTSTGLAVYDINSQTSTAAGANRSGYATISNDGNLIAFQSDSDSVVSGDSNGKKDIFLLNRTTNVVTKLTNTFGSANYPMIAPDGSYVVYSIVDEASILTPNPNNGLYVYNIAAGTSSRLPDSNSGILGLGLGFAHISANSQYITYRGGATANETKLFDRSTSTVSTGNTELLNIGSAGLLSDDGNYRVIMAPDATNLVPNDTNGFPDLFIISTGGVVTPGGGTTTPPTTPPVTPPVTPPTTSPLTGVTATNNFFSTSATAKGFSITPVSRNASPKVSEIALFAVDDLNGKIGNLTPSQTGYLAAALAAAKPVFSTLAAPFFTANKREISLDPNKIYQAIEIADGSLLEAQQQIAAGQTPTNLRLSDGTSNSPIKVTNSATGFKVSVDSDALVLDVSGLGGSDPAVPIGAKSQNLAEGRLIDLTDYAGQTLKVSLTNQSSAYYQNQIGFYEVKDVAGTITINGKDLKPGDVGYAEGAVRNAILQSNKTDVKTDQDITGGKLFAPVVISQGSFSSFLASNPTNGGGGNVVHAYFNYMGANPDKVDHFRLLGNNTFGVEDVFGGGDRDFNDIVINMTFKP